MVFSRWRGAAGAAALLLVAACGGGSGGGSGGGGGGPSVDQPPHFTSAAAFSVVENTTGSYQATASDGDGDTLGFAISGGADAARFTLSPTGLLRFAAAPNYEAPDDADGDNVYAVTLSVSDGRLSDTLNLQVTVTNSKEGIQVRRIATGFDQPLFVAPVPGDRRVFVLEKTGNVMLLDPVTGARSLFLDASLAPDATNTLVRNISTAGEGGLLGLATHPGFATNGIFVVYSTDRNGDISIRRFWRSGGGQGDPRSQVALMTIPHRQFTNHYGGWIGFGPDGFLYIATGDGGGAGDPGNNSQDTGSRLGKILRASIPADPFAGASPTYIAPAPGNPFLAGGGDPYVYAYGFRNPFRAAFFAGGLLIGDVGQDAVEEVDLLAGADRGGNFGWPYKEGSRAYRGTAPVGLTDPVTEYLHGPGPREGRTITGGYVYRGPVASLRDLYVFGDFSTGAIWTLPASALVRGQTLPASRYERRNADFTPDIGTIDQLASFGEDAAGNLYLVDLDGEIYAVTAG